MSDDTETRRVLVMLDELESLTRKSIDLFVEAEWGGWLGHLEFGAASGCLECENEREDGHAPDCRRAAHIAKLREALGVG